MGDVMEELGGWTDGVRAIIGERLLEYLAGRGRVDEDAVFDPGQRGGVTMGWLVSPFSSR